MGIFEREKGAYADIPDERLDWNQRHQKKWESMNPFDTASGKRYDKGCKQQIDGCLQHTLGMHDIDDLFEMKAPRFYAAFRDTVQNAYDASRYLYHELPNQLADNNRYQQLQGKYDELKQQCGQKDVMIEKLMAQNEKLQTQLLEKLNIQSPSFSR